MTSIQRGVAGWLAACAAAVLLLGGCATRGNVQARDVAWSNAGQLVLVTTADWNATQGTLRTFERARGAWREVGNAVPITVGRNGSAWGLGLSPAQADGPQKKEGDGRAPAGVFAIGPAFGYAGDADTALPYEPMRASNWCMDVVDSPLYNKIVDANDVGEAAVKGSSEPMRLDIHAKGDQRYRNGFVIEHNAQAAKGAGSCIFAHLWKAPGETTAGCTAMAPESMQRLYAWLDPKARPVFALLPEAELARVRGDWDLP